MRRPQPSFRLAFFFFFALSTLVPMLAARPSPAQQNRWSWVTFKPPGEGFSVLMPRQPSPEPVEMPGLDGTAYSATGGRIYYTVKSIRAERGGTPQSRLVAFTARFREAFSQTSHGARLTYVGIVHAGNFDGQHYRVSSPNGPGLVRIYSAARHIYVLEVAGGDEEDAPVGWFLDSFTIEEPPAGGTQTGGGGGRGGGASQGGGKANQGGGNQPPVIHDFRLCACDPLGNLTESPGTEAQLTRNAVICTKGDLDSTDEAIKHEFNGDVILRAELLPNGKVGGIEVIQSQPYGLEQKAVEAARQYKFCPALLDGQPVTQMMRLTCSFSFTTIYTVKPAPAVRSRRRP